MRTESHTQRAKAQLNVFLPQPETMGLACQGPVMGVESTPLHGQGDHGHWPPWSPAAAMGRPGAFIRSATDFAVTLPFITI